MSKKKADKNNNEEDKLHSKKSEHKSNKKNKVSHKKENKEKVHSEKKRTNFLNISLIVIAALLLIIISFYAGYNYGLTKNNKLVDNNKEEQIVITEFGDFQCPFCKKFFKETYPKLKSTYGDKIRFEFKHFPLGFHQYAEKASEAALCAEDQGKFWEYHDLLFDTGKFDYDNLINHAKELKLDINKFKNCLDSGVKEAKINEDKKEALALGVRGTPTFFINGQQILGAQPFDVFKKVIDAALRGEKYINEKPQQAAPKPKEVPKTEKPKVELFVMSYCPFGLQMEKATLPVINLLKDYADFEIKFVNYAMHGLKEVNENTLQYCLEKNNKEAYWKYLDCFTKTGENESCLIKAGVNYDSLKDCLAEADNEFNIMADYNDKASWLSGRFPKYEVHDKECKEYGVRGSPTLIINGVNVRVNRDPESVKKAVCDAFKEKPSVCDNTLSSESASPGFGSGTGNNAEGGCGA